MINYVLYLSLFILVSGNEVYKNYAEHGACGVASTLSLRIVGGEEAKKSEFPWVVSLTRRGGHLCGGTIISEKFVVTAAHCVCTGIDDETISSNSIKVTVGQYDFDEEKSSAYNIGVKTIIRHPNYKCSIPKDDIALLRLSENIIWSENIAPACVLNFLDRDEFDDSLATVAGWGWTHENREIGKRASKLKKGKVFVINTDICKQWYQRNERKIEIQDSHICAGHKNGGTDACWADSGGPLVKPVNEGSDKMMLIGVVSTGIGCGRPGLPGVYTRISDYIPWIESVVEKSNVI